MCQTCVWFLSEVRASESCYHRRPARVGKVRFVSKMKKIYTITASTLLCRFVVLLLLLLLSASHVYHVFSWLVRKETLCWKIGALFAARERHAWEKLNTMMMLPFHTPTHAWCCSGLRDNVSCDWSIHTARSEPILWLWLLGISHLAPDQNCNAKFRGTR